jgi:hypothetical protein
MIELPGSNLKQSSISESIDLDELDREEKSSSFEYEFNLRGEIEKHEASETPVRRSYTTVLKSSKSQSVRGPKVEAA